MIIIIFCRLGNKWIKWIYREVKLLLYLLYYIVVFVNEKENFLEV